MLKIESGWTRNALLLIVGGLLGGLITSAWEHSYAMAQQDNPQPTLPSLEADIARLKQITPPSSHPMVDVAMFAANVWFAEQKKNWPLANYYFGEMRNRMNWEVKLNPSPKGADGKPVDMASILDGINNGSLAAMKKAIDMKDALEFEVQYKHMLEDCYSCHKVNGRTYLRPQIPVTGAQPIVNLDPAASWPQ